MTTQKGAARLLLSHEATAAAVFALDLGRALYSTTFYQEIDWHCYEAFGLAVRAGERDYAALSCDMGMMYYPAGFAWV